MLLRVGRRAAPYVVVLLAVIVFAGSLFNDFTLDDALASSQMDGRPNRMIAELHAPQVYFTSDYWAARDVRSGLYRPATIYSFALTHHLLGMLGVQEAFPHHLINVLLNALAALLVFWLMRDLGVAVLGAFLAACLFGVHTVHSEVVATVIGRGELFAFCFGMAGLFALRRTSGVWWGLAVGAYFFAFCSKESALAWVPMTVCYFLARRWMFHEVVPWRRIGIAVVPGLLLFSVLRSLAIDGPIEPIQYAANPLAHVDTMTRLWTALDLWGRGLLLCVKPWPLACMYGPAATPLLTGPTGLGFWILLAAVGGAGLVVWNARRWPALFLAAAFLFGFSFLTSNVPFAIGTMFGERLFYTPSLGVCMLPALLLARCGDRGRSTLVGICVCFALLNASLDFSRSVAWSSNDVLFRIDSAAHPDTAVIQVTAARTFEVLGHGRSELFSVSPLGRRSLEEYLVLEKECIARARAADPEYVDAARIEALRAARDGKANAAIAGLEACLKMRRLAVSGLESSIRKDLGRLLITHAEQYERGLDEVAKALRLRPQDTELRTRLINIALQRLSFLVARPDKNVAGARETAAIGGLLFEALPPEDRGQEQFLVTRIHYGDALATLGRKAAAREAWQAVLAEPAADPVVRAQASKRLQSLSR